MKEIVEEELEEAYEKEAYNENEHIIKMWQPLEFNIDENYKYVKKGKIFTWFSNMLYYGVAIPVLYVLTKAIYDLKIEGKENLTTLQTGAVTVSNHVLVLDCAMVGLALDEKKVYYTTLEDSFKIPLVRHLIKLLRAIPIPAENKNKPHFMNALDSILKKRRHSTLLPRSLTMAILQQNKKLQNRSLPFRPKKQCASSTNGIHL